MRAAAFLVSVVAAPCLLLLGGIFRLNGEQWGWWARAAWAGAGLVFCAGVFWPALRGRPAPGSGRSPAVTGLAGAALVTVSVVVMARRYSDPYAGPLLWPHALAVVALLGLALVVAGVGMWAEGQRS